MSRIRSIFVAPLLVAWMGCASAPPPVTYYLLRGDSAEGAGPIEVEARAGLGRVVVAPYLLGSRGLMVETQDGEVRPAALHQWAEPLDAGLRWYLRGQVATDLGHQMGGGLTDMLDWDYTVDVFVSRLHGTMEGRAGIEAVFVVRSSGSGEAPAEYRFARSVAIPEEGYAGLVEAERSLLRELAGMIADALRAELEGGGEDSEG